MEKIPVIIDVDTGIDDAMALVCACASSRLDILGVTTVAGNVDLVHTLRNTMNVLDLLGRNELKVAAGENKPLRRELLRASFVHGANGLRGYNFDSDVDYALVDKHAVEFTKELLERSSQKVTILALGPLTNIGMLLEKYPEIKNKIEKIVFMGTSFNDGNPTPVTTFNVKVDPEAFDICINSGVPFYGVSLNATRQGYISEYEKNYIRDCLQGPAAELIKGILFNYGGAVNDQAAEIAKIPTENEEEIPPAKRIARNMRKAAIHDAVTVVFLTNPELFDCHRYYCRVETEGELTTGYTYIDKSDYYCKEENEKNIYFVDSVDREGFVSCFMEAIKHFDNESPFFESNIE